MKRDWLEIGSMNRIGTNTYVHLFLLACLCCFGCGSTDTKQGELADPASRPFAENLKEAVEQANELKFCASEGVGVETLKATFDRMVTVMDSLPASVKASTLSPKEQTSLTAAVEEIQAACKKSGMNSESDYAGLLKEIAKPLKVLGEHTQQ